MSSLQISGSQSSSINGQTLSVWTWKAVNSTWAEMLRPIEQLRELSASSRNAFAVLRLSKTGAGHFLPISIQCTQKEPATPRPCSDSGLTQQPLGP